MARQIPLAPAASWFRLELEPADWSSEAAQDLSNWYAQMLLIRRFEEKLLDLEKAGLIHGPAHASIGQEAGAVGAMSALTASDKINGTHRTHHQVLTKLVGSVIPEGFDIRGDDFTPEMDDRSTVSWRKSWA
jgi:2-oxoisovalerate dehydrogenase E1 component